MSSTGPNAGHSRTLRFAVTTALLAAPATIACAAKSPDRTNMAPQPPTVNEGPQPDPGEPPTPNDGTGDHKPLDVTPTGDQGTAPEGPTAADGSKPTKPPVVSVNPGPTPPKPAPKIMVNPGPTTPPTTKPRV